MTPPNEAVLHQRLLTMRIMVFALITGPLAALVIFAFMRQGGQFNKPPGDLPILSYVSLAFGVVNLALSLAIPNFTAQATCKRIAQGTWTVPLGAADQFATDAAKLWAVYQTRLIIGLAFVEGATLLLAIAYLMEGTIACLVAAMVLIAFQATRFPTRAGVESWVEKQLAGMEHERGAM